MDELHDTTKEFKFDNLFSDNEIPDFINKSMNSIYKDILGKKEKIIKDRLSFLGIELNQEFELKARFKNFQIEKQGNEERYYYNDGSAEGQLIVVFISKPFNMKDFKIDFSFNYRFGPLN